jgi:outer membrane biosynthesis protein TonB
VRTPSDKKPLLIVVACGLVGAAIALIIVMKGGNKDVPAAAQEPATETVMPSTPSQADEAPTAVDQPKVEEPTVEAKTDTPKVETPKVETPKVETPKVETKTTPKAETKTTPKVEAKTETPKVVAKPKTAKAKTETKTETKQEQKKWNSNSVFLPVRTDK